MDMRKRGWLLLLALALALTGCGNGSLMEGRCRAVVEFVEIPEEFESLPEWILEKIEIKVRLQNIATQKDYVISLDRDNHFRQRLRLNPGIYKVDYCYLSPGKLAGGMEVEALQQQLELSRENTAALEIRIAGPESFRTWVEGMEAAPEIESAELFSRKVQLDGRVIDLERIADYVSFKYDDLVKGYEKITLYNSDYGIRLSLQNQTRTEQPWTSCAVTGVEFTENNVIFGKGVQIGMPVEEVCREETGRYGLPHKMTGTVLIGIGYDQTRAVYVDEASGDKATLSVAPSGNYICGIVYEFARYE